MKKIIIGLMCVLILMGCSNNSQATKQDNNQKTNDVELYRQTFDFLVNK